MSAFVIVRLYARQHHFIILKKDRSLFQYLKREIWRSALTIVQFPYLTTQVKSCQKLSKRRSVQNYPASRGSSSGRCKTGRVQKTLGHQISFLHMKLRMIIQKCREFNKDLYMCFIDCSKAFDCVSHSQLWGTLRKMGFPGRELNLGKVLYTSQETSICTNCGTQNGSK